MAITAADRAVIGRILFTLTALLVGAGLYLTGEAAWIHAKAKLAQGRKKKEAEESQGKDDKVRTQADKDEMAAFLKGQ